MLGQVIFSTVYRGTSFTELGFEYRLMNGQSIARATYPALSAIWASGAFNSNDTSILLPNAAELYPRGADLGRGADPNSTSRIALAGTFPSGVNAGSYQDGAYGPHVHQSGSQLTPSFPNIAGNAGGAARTVAQSASLETTAQVMAAQAQANTNVSGSSASNWEPAHKKVWPYIRVL